MTMQEPNNEDNKEVSEQIDEVSKQIDELLAQLQGKERITFLRELVRGVNELHKLTKKADFNNEMEEEQELNELDKSWEFEELDKEVESKLEVINLDYMDSEFINKNIEKKEIDSLGNQTLDEKQPSVGKKIANAIKAAMTFAAKLAERGTLEGQIVAKQVEDKCRTIKNKIETAYKLYKLTTMAPKLNNYAEKYAKVDDKFYSDEEDLKADKEKLKGHVENSKNRKLDRKFHVVELKAKRKKNQGNDITLL